jgi:hypothetical protein
MTLLIDAVISQPVGSDPTKLVRLTCPACFGRLQTRASLVGKTGHCVHCRTSLRAEPDGSGGVLAVAINGNDSPLLRDPESATGSLVSRLSKDDAGLPQLPDAGTQTTFASSAKIPSQWGFPDRTDSEDLPMEFAPRGFAEALFGQESSLNGQNTEAAQP